MKEKIRLLKQTISWTMLFFLIINTVSAQVNYSESFDTITFLPTGWTAPGATNFWGRAINGMQPTCMPHSGAGMARFTRNAPPNTYQVIASPVIDYSNLGTDTARVSIWIFRDDGAPTVFDFVALYINTSPVLTGAHYFGSIARSRFISVPDTQATNNWYQYIYDVPDSFNTNTNYLLIKASNDVNQGNNIFIDDVEWNAFPTACSGIPAAGAISSSTQLICGGSGSATLTLSGQSTDAGISYQWQSSSSAIGPWTNFGSGSAFENTGTISSTTYYQCLVTCSNSGLTDSTAIDSVAVSQNPAPVVTATPPVAAYCQGNNPAMLAASGAATFTWAPPTGLNVSTGDTVFATPTNNTIFIVTGTDANGCSDTASVNVFARPALNIFVNANPDTVCEGGQVNLHAMVGGPGIGTTFTWNPGNLNGDNQMVHPIQNITYTVLVSVLNGSCTGSDSIHITVTPGPVAGFTYTINAGTVVFTNTSTNATNYAWNYGDGNFSSQVSPTYTYSGSGVYNVMLIAFNGNCAPDTFNVSIPVITGISDLGRIIPASITPNPFNDFITLQFSSDKSEVNFELLNAQGTIIQKRILYVQPNSVDKEKIDLTMLPSSLYAIRLTVAGKSTCIKIIKQ